MHDIAIPTGVRGESLSLRNLIIAGAVITAGFLWQGHKRDVQNAALSQKVVSILGPNSAAPGHYIRTVDLAPSLVEQFSKAGMELAYGKEKTVTVGDITLSLKAPENVSNCKGQKLVATRNNNSIIVGNVSFCNGPNPFSLKISPELS